MLGIQDFPYLCQALLAREYFMPLLKHRRINLLALAIIAESGPGVIEQWYDFQSQMQNTFIQRNDTL